MKCDRQGSCRLLSAPRRSSRVTRQPPRRRHHLLGAGLGRGPESCSASRGQPTGERQPGSSAGSGRNAPALGLCAVLPTSWGLGKTGTWCVTRRPCAVGARRCEPRVRVCRLERPGMEACGDLSLARQPSPRRSGASTVLSAPTVCARGACGRAHCLTLCHPALTACLLFSLESSANSADAASSKFIFGQNMSERVLVSDPHGDCPSRGPEGFRSLPQVTGTCGVWLLP